VYSNSRSVDGRTGRLIAFGLKSVFSDSDQFGARERVKLIGGVPRSTVVSDRGANEPIRRGQRRRISDIGGGRADRRVLRLRLLAWPRSSACRGPTNFLRCIGLLHYGSEAEPPEERNKYLQSI
jgi:hypothetical protein